MKRLLCAILLVWVASWLSARAQTPMEWLERMERSERRVALEGVRVTQFFLPVPLPPVRERLVRAGARYRVEYLQPPGRQGEVLIDDGLRRYHFLPRLKQLQVLPSEQPLVWRRRQELLRRLRRGDLVLSVKGVEPVAGRRAVLLEARNPQGRPLQRWWIDRQYGVILRLEELTPKGEVRLRSEYVRIKVPADVPQERFVPRFPEHVVRQNILPPLRVFASVEEAQPLVPFTIRQPRQLPRDFHLAEVRVRLMGARPLVSLHYTDEVSSLALFQTRLPLRANALKSLAPPATQVDSWRDGDVNLALIGNAPKEAFDQLRDALR